MLAQLKQLSQESSCGNVPGVLQDIVQARQDECVSMTMPSLPLTCSMGWSQWTVRWTRPLQSFSALAKAQNASTVQHPSMHPQLTVARPGHPGCPEVPGCPERQSRQGWKSPLFGKLPCLRLM